MLFSLRRECKGLPRSHTSLMKKTPPFSCPTSRQADGERAIAARFEKKGAVVVATTRWARARRTVFFYCIAQKAGSPQRALSKAGQQDKMLVLIGHDQFGGVVCTRGLGREREGRRQPRSVSQRKPLSEFFPALHTPLSTLARPVSPPLVAHTSTHGLDPPRHPPRRGQGTRAGRVFRL